MPLTDTSWSSSTTVGHILFAMPPHASTASEGSGEYKSNKEFARKDKERATIDKMWVVFVLSFPFQLLSVLLIQKQIKIYIHNHN